MIQQGMALRYEKDYKGEVELATSLGFDFFQLWFYNGSLSANALKEPKEQRAKDFGFPIILHAVFDMQDYEKYGHELLRLLEFFGHKEVIIHPICKHEPITDHTVVMLNEKLQAIHRELAKRNIKLYVENNSVIDGFFNTVAELRVVFDANPGIGLLLDLAHVNDYDHLEEIIDMRFPECIHIADKRFGVPHEHIALGKGDLDFKLIFQEMLAGYDGRVILEAVDSKEEIAESKSIMDALFD